MSDEVLRTAIRTIPDFPSPGILYRDVTTLLADPVALRRAVDGLAEVAEDGTLDAVAGIEARGFVFGAAVAVRLGCAFVPLRKPGKLPYETIGVDYELEYGSDRLEMHVDAVDPGARVLLVDDLIATGGTALAGVGLLRSAGAEVVGAAFVVDLPDLGGAAALREAGVDVHTLVGFDGH